MAPYLWVSLFVVTVGVRRKSVENPVSNFSHCSKKLVRFSNSNIFRYHSKTVKLFGTVAVGWTPDEEGDDDDGPEDAEPDLPLEDGHEFED